MNFKQIDRDLIKTSLLKQIQLIREDLINTGIKEGISHEKTIRISQKLDEFILLYQSVDTNQSSFPQDFLNCYVD